MIHRSGGKTGSATGRVVFENDLELITFTLDGHLLHTHKATFAQRHSLGTWPDIESAKKAFESGQISWGEPE
jgi:hypothetical protein